MAYGFQGVDPQTFYAKGMQKRTQALQSYTSQNQGGSSESRGKVGEPPKTAGGGIGAAAGGATAGYMIGAAAVPATAAATTAGTAAGTGAVAGAEGGSVGGPGGAAIGAVIGAGIMALAYFLS